MNFFENRKLRKQLKHIIHTGDILRASREDVMTAGQLAYIDEYLGKARHALAEGDRDEMVGAGNELTTCIEKLDPPKALDTAREWFDILVVAISVAMAFRAYFYQPFKIPTGSMQPTLYGIHTTSRPVEDMTVLDHQPFKFFKWLVTGQSFKVVRAKASGSVSFGDLNQSKKPGYMPILVGGVAHYLPNDVFMRSADSYGLKGGVRFGERVKAGDVLWSGVITSGDFLFVNRWKWNFRHPRRGDIMVFSTTGIQGVTPGTHYIKRMMGLPNETLQIKAPNLLVNGEAVTTPERVGQIARREQIGDWAPPYAGFNAVGNRVAAKSLVTEEDIITLGLDEYYAIGDNSFGSFDSRAWGPVPERNLLGPASFVHWPFTSPRWGRIK
ncbi:MAG: signal peptidase I [Kiritimatiellaeota bacterium]|nr:signal peptidase I [Kiritimatiellota bacterium]